MRDLKNELKLLLNRNRDGSFSTQATRTSLLNLIAGQLHQAGYTKMTIHDIGDRHVQKLMARWKREGLKNGTMKNRVTVLRWWGEKVNRPVVRPENSAYGIGKRVYVTNVSQACDLPAQKLARVTDEHVRMSLELQQVFGLRREESLKLQPAYADQGDRLVLKGSWTKGGKPREIPLLTPRQREVLNRAQALVGNGSMIPRERSYAQHVKIYERQTANAGLTKMHGLRHAYAQRRYEELAGWKSPKEGGPTRQALTQEQKRVDFAVREKISKELGHERERITAVYLGR